MSKSLDFIFDFASPNAYFAYHALQPILENTNTTLNIIPCLLGGIFKTTNNQPPMLAFAQVNGKLDYERLEIKRFIEKHQLSSFTFNPHFPVNSIVLMRGAIAMQKENRLEDYVKAGLKAMWEDGLKMDDTDVFSQTMTEHGFDGVALLEKIQNPEVKQQLATNTQDAVDRGCFGVPTFYIGSEMFFGKERLQQIEEYLKK